MKKKCTFFWFRRDLRLEDNIGLHYALKSGHPVMSFFIFDKNILKKLKDKEDKRVQFIYNTLLELKEKLQSLGSDLIIAYDTPKEAWKKVSNEFNIQSVYTNEDYEPYAIKRDRDIESFFKKRNIPFHTYKDQCIFSKNDILKNNGKPYTVYTPYKNKWLESLTPKDLGSVKSSHLFKNFLQIEGRKAPSIQDIGFVETTLPKIVKSIKSKVVKNYHLDRDFPERDATSHLSLHLRFGTVSVRKCAQVGYELNSTWLNELIWREFFMQILYHFPHVAKAPFKEKYNNIPWENNRAHFKKWCEGKTGYPLVDAGMRELNQTGYMHNRVRMICASFLIKHLLIDYRWGEKYFAQKLLDFDLSANNGNWQWVAGTGCDAAPYFRVFNPETQQKKFDKEFLYIKKWVPEFGTDDYPERIVDHKMAYNRALTTYKDL